MRLTATKTVARLTPALLAAMAVSVLASGVAQAAKPSGGGGGTTSGGKTTRDTTPPTVSISTPTSGSTLGSSQDTVAGTASDNVSVASVTVSVDGGTYVAASGTTSWSDVVNSLSNGSHTLTAKATDGAGNSSTASVTVSVSTGTSGGGSGGTATPPTSTITEPPYDAAVVAGTYTLTGASSDSTYSITREEWDVDGVAVASGTSTTGLSYDWDTSKLAQGSHTLTYRTWNSAGAEGDASRPVSVGSATVKRVAVILYNFQNQAPPTTPATVQDWTFTGTRSVAGYYQEQTFGRLLLGGQYSATGDVFGFYTVPYAYPTAPCNFTPWETSALQQATAAGVNLKGYDVVMLTAAVPSGCGSGVGGGSQDRVPWNNPATPDQWISFAAHELGHSFGVHHHAAAWTCTDSSGHTVQVGGSCTSSEYGDPYDIMGGGSVQHMNAYELGQIGVLRPGNVQTVTAAGTYTLNPLTAPSTGVQTIRIPRAYDASGNATDFYYLEYRQPAAYDVPPANVVDYDGVLVREAPDFAAATTVSNLVDTTPGSSTLPWVHDNFDAALTPGRYFQDAAAGITVSTVSVSGTGASVRVSFGTPQCVRVAPTMSLSPASQSGAAGATLTYTAILANNDAPACGASSFDVAGSLPAGFTQSPGSYGVAGLYPAGTVTTWTLTVASPSTQPSGSYAFTETATSQSSGMTGSVTGTAVVQ